MAIGVEALGAPHHPGQRLERHPGNVDLGLLRGQRHPGRLGVESKLEAALVGGSIAVAHPLGPDATSGPELAHLLEEVHMAVEEETQPRCEGVHRKTSSAGRLHVCKPIGQSEGQFLGGRGAGFPDVVTGDRYGVPPGHLGRGEPNDVGDQADRRPGREQVLLLGLVFLENVVLKRAGQAGSLHAGLLGHHHVHGQQDGSRTVDGHGRGDGP